MIGLSHNWTDAIYVVDDDAALRLSVLTLVGAAFGVAAEGFPSGDAFLAALPRLAPGCIILDFDMPGTDGLEVLASIRYAGERFQTVFLTGEGDVALAVRALKSGAFDFLEKPCAPDVIIACVAAARQQLHEDIAAVDRARAAKDKIARLTGRETEVLERLIHGRSNKVIAYELNISPRTVEIYRANVMDKLGVRTLSDALRIAFAAGMAGT